MIREKQQGEYEGNQREGKNNEMLLALNRLSISTACFTFKERAQRGRQGGIIHICEVNGQHEKGGDK